MVLAVVGLTAGIVAVLALFVVAIPSLTEENKVSVQLGDDRFDFGPAAARADAIDRDGPVLLPDVASGQREIWVQHLGDDPEAGWLVFDARRADAGRECPLVWVGADEHFVDDCTGEVVPADGDGLRQYSVEVVDGVVFIDLRTSTGTSAVPSAPPEPTPGAGASSDAG